MLQIIDRIPDGLATVAQADLGTLFSGPTLMHLEGRKPERLFVTVLQHGNEDVGLRAVQNLLIRYRDRELPRSLSVFFANIEAARANQRRLPHQPDYNRVWPGGETETCLESEMMREVVDTMSRRPLFASVDLHNNIGLNPHYACINRTDNRFLQLATLFSRTVVYFTQPRGVQSMAFAALCPAVTLECGQAGNEHGVNHATEFLDACLHLEHIPDHPVHDRDIDLFHTTAVVKVPAQVRLGIGNEDGDIVLIHDLEFFNFRELQPGTVFGTVKTARGDSLLVIDDQGQNRIDDYFEIEDGQLRLRRTVMPSMLTVNKTAIRQDCLCYFMERFPLPRAE